MAGEQLIIPPAAEPISLEDAKLHLRIESDVSDDDSLIRSMISAARILCEDYLRRQIVMATWKLTLDAFPWSPRDPIGGDGARPNAYMDDRSIVLPYPRLQAVSSIGYLDEEGDTQTLSSDLYVVDDASEPARIMPAYGQSWPEILRRINSLTVTYTAGWMVPFTVNATTDVISTTGKAPTNGEAFRLVAINGADGTAGTLPAGLSASTNYYVVSASGQTCQFATSAGGSAIDITDTGTGTLFLDMTPEAVRHAIRLTLTHLYENRGDADSEMPSAAKALLGSYRIWRF